MVRPWDERNALADAWPYGCRALLQDGPLDFASDVDVVAMASFSSYTSQTLVVLWEEA